MTPTAWPCPLPCGGTGQEYALAFDRGRADRLLIVPALFDEANRMRRLTVEVVRRLDGAGIDSFLPDLPGCNESPQALEPQSLASWRTAVAAAAKRFGATRLLGVRGGCLLLPGGIPGWCHAPAKGTGILRQMLRARVIASREAGVSETGEALLATGLAEGLELAGYRMGPALVRELQESTLPQAGAFTEIPQDTVGGAGLWLRAEPGESREQADALAAIVAMGFRT